jgi:hypothetical protein
MVGDLFPDAMFAYRQIPGGLGDGHYKNFLLHQSSSFSANTGRAWEQKPSMLKLFVISPKSTEPRLKMSKTWFMPVWRSECRGHRIELRLEKKTLHIV